MFEKEYKVAGRYKKESDRKFFEFLKSMGYQIPTAASILKKEKNEVQKIIVGLIVCST